MPATVKFTHATWGGVWSYIHFFIYALNFYDLCPQSGRHLVFVRREHRGLCVWNGAWEFITNVLMGVYNVNFDVQREIKECPRVRGLWIVGWVIGKSVLISQSWLQNKLVKIVLRNMWPCILLHIFHIL